MRLLCWLGFHRRSRASVRTGRPRIEGHCGRCGAAMHKRWGKWVLNAQD